MGSAETPRFRPISPFTGGEGGNLPSTKDTQLRGRQPPSKLPASASQRVGKRGGGGGTSAHLPVGKPPPPPPVGCRTPHAPLSRRPPVFVPLAPPPPGPLPAGRGRAGAPPSPPRPRPWRGAVRRGAGLRCAPRRWAPRPELRPPPLLRGAPFCAGSRGRTRPER